MKSVTPPDDSRPVGEVAATILSEKIADGSDGLPQMFFHSISKAVKTPGSGSVDSVLGPPSERSYDRRNVYYLLNSSELLSENARSMQAMDAVVESQRNSFEQARRMMEVSLRTVRQMIDRSSGSVWIPIAEWIASRLVVEIGEVDEVLRFMSFPFDHRRGESIVTKNDIVKKLEGISFEIVPAAERVNIVGGYQILEVMLFKLFSESPSFKLDELVSGKVSSLRSGNGSVGRTFVDVSKANVVNYAKLHQVLMGVVDFDGSSGWKPWFHKAVRYFTPENAQLQSRREEAGLSGGKLSTRLGRHMDVGLTKVGKRLGRFAGAASRQLGGAIPSRIVRM